MLFKDLSESDCPENCPLYTAKMCYGKLSYVDGHIAYPACACFSQDLDLDAYVANHKRCETEFKSTECKRLAEERNLGVNRALQASHIKLSRKAVSSENKEIRQLNIRLKRVSDLLAVQLKTDADPYVVHELNDRMLKLNKRIKQLKRLKHNKLKLLHCKWKNESCGCATCANSTSNSDNLCIHRNDGSAIDLSLEHSTVSNDEVTCITNAIAFLQKELMQAYRNLDAHVKIERESHESFELREEIVALKEKIEFLTKERKDKLDRLHTELGTKESEVI